MIDRVNNYYQLPASPAMLRHMREDIGLVGKYRDIFNDLRDCRGSTQMHADNVGVTVKQCNLMSGIVGQTCIM